jgi:hypothetical protein
MFTFFEYMVGIIICVNSYFTCQDGMLRDILVKEHLFMYRCILFMKIKKIKLSYCHICYRKL